MSAHVLRRAAAGWLSVHTQLTARHAYAPAHVVYASHAVNTRGKTAGEIGEDAAHSMQGAEEQTAEAGEKVESRVSDSGFMPDTTEFPAAVPSPDAAGTAGGISSETMGSVVDAMDAVMHEDQPRVAEDLHDITAGHSGASTADGTPHAAVSDKDGPGGLHTPNNPLPPVDTPPIQPGDDTQDVYQTPSAPTGSTIPSINPSQDKPELDQDPLARSL